MPFTSSYYFYTSVSGFVLTVVILNWGRQIIWTSDDIITCNERLSVPKSAGGYFASRSPKNQISIPRGYEFTEAKAHKPWVNAFHPLTIKRSMGPIQRKVSELQGERTWGPRRRCAHEHRRRTGPRRLPHGSPSGKIRKLINFVGNKLWFVMNRFGGGSWLVDARFGCRIYSSRFFISEKQRSVDSSISFVYRDKLPRVTQ